MLNLAGGLAQSGYIVDLVLVRRSGAYVDAIPPNVSVVDLNAGRTIFSARALRQYIQAAKPVALVSALPHVNIVAVLATRLCRRRPVVVVTEHVHVSIDAKKTRLPLIRLAYRLSPLVYRWADHIVAVSGGAADDLSRHLGIRRDRVRVIYNPVVTRAFGEQSSVPNHPWLTNKAAPVIVAMGRLSPEKNFPLLLNAFAALRRQRPVRLMILGEGDDRGLLEQMVNELDLRADVCMPGFVTDVRGYLRAADLYVLSSQWEALPTALIEAMACGTPVVATNCPSGPAEILQGGQFGLLVPPDDEALLATAMARVLDGERPPGRPMDRVQAFDVSTAAASYASLFDGHPRCV